MNIHIQRDGQQMGPYTLEQINEYLTQGALLATDSAWHEGMIEWVQIGRVQGVTIPGKPAPEPISTRLLSFSSMKSIT